MIGWLDIAVVLQRTLKASTVARETIVNIEKLADYLILSG